MVTNCFSHLLPNLFIGLSKGSHQLRPYSQEFKKLGYTVFRFEPFFPISSGEKTNPDAVIISKRLGNTIIIEWTEAKAVHDDKRKQLPRYSKIKRSDLTDVLAVPQTAAKNHDVSVIISPIASESFTSFLKQNNLTFPLLEFSEVKNEFRLTKSLFDFAESNTNEFFSKPMNFLRIPRRYLPFSLDDISHKQLVPHIITHLLSLLRKGTKEFTIDVFCSRYIPAWDFVDIRKQGEVKKVTKKVLVNLLGRSIGRELLKRLEKDPPTWEIIDDSLRRRSMRSIRKSLEEFIAEVKGKEFQLEFDY